MSDNSWENKRHWLFLIWLKSPLSSVLTWIADALISSMVYIFLLQKQDQLSWMFEFSLIRLILLNQPDLFSL